ncbi:MAG: aminoglycoside phosphotransferase family protein [Thermomicrobiales bacterium]
MITAGTVPDDFAEVTVLRSGAAGRAWLDRLPVIVDACARRWELTLGAPLVPLSYNYIVPARRTDGSTAILKVCVPTGEFALQVEALRLFDGRGAVRLLASDPDDETMLLEGCEPGTLRQVTTVDDDQATTIACGVMRQLWRPALPTSPFPTMFDWNADLGRLRPQYGGETGPFPRVLVEEVETLLAELTVSAPAPILLHGDLHYDNILPARRQPWLAIDPKGLTGEPAYETGALLYNPYPLLLGGPDPKRTLARRIDQLADELSLDRVRVRGWGLVRATLSSWWHVESTGHIRGAALTCAELLADIRA